MANTDKMDQRTYFRHGEQTQKDIEEIEKYLQDELPGKQINTSDAIRFAIGKTAEQIREKIMLQVMEQMDREQELLEIEA